MFIYLIYKNIQNKSSFLVFPGHKNPFEMAATEFHELYFRILLKYRETIYTWSDVMHMCNT